MIEHRVGIDWLRRWFRNDVRGEKFEEYETGRYSYNATKLSWHIDNNA